MVDGVAFPPMNEGHSGYVIGGGAGPLAFFPGIAPLVVNALQTYHPHIVTLMIGTNDVNLSDDLPNAPQRLADLVDSILGTDPTLLLVLAQITPSTSDSLNANIQTYNAAMPALVAARAMAGKHIVLVDMYDALASDPSYATADFSDMVHPNDTGYTHMAKVWYAAIRGLLR
jgi:lysophospholipase L1-like esterase